MKAVEQRTDSHVQYDTVRSVRRKFMQGEKLIRIRKDLLLRLQSTCHGSIARRQGTYL